MTKLESGSDLTPSAFWRPDGRKRNVLGVLVDAVDYDAAAAAIISAARERHPFCVAALAVHGVMTGVVDTNQRYRINHFDLAAPDGQPVRWALNILHRAGLKEQVRGTDLTLRVLNRAAAEGLPVYFDGSHQVVVATLATRVRRRIPGLVVAGCEPSKFRPMTLRECRALARRIVDSNARLVFVGLGCPRQEVFCYEMRNLVPVPLIAVGAAFDYLAGHLPEPPAVASRLGLEWLWRLAHEPKRLWRRYVLLNPAYLCLLSLQVLRVWRPDIDGTKPPPATSVEA
jgi:exopolysaccharide biosynthesis WecB/TagA/CpsF family protein